MTTTKTIPAERLRGLDVHQGDTLHILAVMDSAFLVQFSRNEPASSEPPGKASEWLRTAKGSVQLAPNESPDDARMGYYTAKYGLNR
jgi:hypothetical protein